MLLLFLSREVAGRPCSEAGDSARQLFDNIEEEGRLLSLSLAVSSTYIDRLLDTG